MQIRLADTVVQINQVIGDDGKVEGLYVGSPDNLDPEGWIFIPSDRHDSTGTESEGG